MTDFFKNNPTALRHCIRFEVLQGTPIEKAYSNICSVIGEEEQEKSIAEILRNDKYALRVCILYESMKYKSGRLNGPVFEVFVNFCKAIGDEDVLKYPEFEFWFYRFLNGESDLNYERDENKKIYELVDMPIDVMENIAEYLDIFDRANLIDTSRSLRTFFKEQKLFHPTLKLDVSMRRASVTLGESVYIKYIKNRSGCTKIYKNCKTRVEGVAHWKQAIRDIRTIFKNPKLHFVTLTIGLNVDEDVEDDVFDYLETALDFNHYLSVKKLMLEEYSGDMLVKILPSLEPGYLKTIDIPCIPDSASMMKVFEMEQWIEAKYFRMDSLYHYFDWPPLDWHHLYHFKKFTVKLKYEFPRFAICNFKETLFQSPDFEKCSVILPRVPDEFEMSIINEEFGDALQEHPYIYHYPIPNSADYFEIKVEEDLFEVTRKKN